MNKLEEITRNTNNEEIIYRNADTISLEQVAAQFQEELAELISALLNLMDRKSAANYINLEEEIAGVYINIKSFCYKTGIHEPHVNTVIDNAMHEYYSWERETNTKYSRTATICADIIKHTNKYLRCKGYGLPVSSTYTVEDVTCNIVTSISFLKSSIDAICQSAGVDIDHIKELYEDGYEKIAKRLEENNTKEN